MAANHDNATIHITSGQKIYHDHCIVCHGTKGDGKTFAANALLPPPKNFTAKTSKTELTLGRMIRSVTEGRANTAMMPWKDVLNKHEILSVVNYIRKDLMQLKQ